MNRTVFMLALSLAVTTVPAWAADAANDAGKKEDCPLHRADLTDAEFAKAQDEMFGKLDANRDGSISREEFAAHHDEMRRKHREHAEAAAEPSPAHQH